MKRIASWLTMGWLVLMLVGCLNGGSNSNNGATGTISTEEAKIKAVTAGGSNMCALTRAGGVLCWGDNLVGELGNDTTTSSNVPVNVTGLSSEVAAISAGYSLLTSGGDHVCALTTAGKAVCWGDNSEGELGNGTTTSSNVAVDVTGLSTDVAAISAGDDFTCALTTGGGVQCWGDNSEGELGDGTTTFSIVPVDVTGLSSGVAAISTGGLSACALTTAGEVLCWGDNSFGELGNGTTTSSTVPVNVTGLSSGVVAISTGEDFACALTTTGGAQCWGDNSFGELGNGTVNQSNVPVDVIGLSSGVAAISAGDEFGCAVTTAGKAQCWGNNSEGELGDGTINQSNIPVDVTGLSSGVAAISAALLHACAVTVAGGVECWGSNLSGALGNGTTVLTIPYSSVPVDVTGL